LASLIRRTMLARVAERSVVPRDATAFVAASLLLVATVEVVQWVGQRVRAVNSRKLLHVVAGPVFLITWPWFTAEGRVWAAMVPAAMTTKFACVGLGLLKDNKAVATMSRSGDKRELLKGPLLYGIVFVAMTLTAWRDVTAAVALMALCFGDAAAEIVGKRYGGANKLPWSPRKSYAGVAGFFIASLLAMSAFSLLFRHWGWTSDLFVGPVFLSALVGALVESCPAPDVDNLFVPASVATTFRLLSQRRKLF